MIYKKTLIHNVDTFLIQLDYEPCNGLSFDMETEPFYHINHTYNEGINVTIHA